MVELSEPEYVTRVEKAVDRVIAATGGDIRLGLPLGLGKPNQFVQHLLESRGPSSTLGTRAKIFYATMVAVHPPTIALFVNEPDMFDQRYQRYLINAFREEFPFAEVPIKLVIRGRQRRSQARDEAPVVET